MYLAAGLRRVIFGALAFAAVISAGLPATSAPPAPSEFEREIALAQQIMPNDPASALSHARRAGELVARDVPPSGQHVAELTRQWLMISALDRLNEDAEAAPLATKVLSDARQFAPDSKLEGHITQAVASVYAATGNVQGALVQYQRAFHIYQKLNEARSEALVLEEIGVLYLDAHDYDHVVKYYNQAMEIFPGDLSLELSRHNNVALALMNMSRLQDAISEFEKGLDVAKKLDSAFLQAQILNNIAACDIALGRLSEADRAVATGLKLTSRQDAEAERRFLIGELGVLSMKRGDLSHAKSLIEETFRGVDLKATDTEFLYFHKAAVELYKQLGDYRLSMAHLEAVKRLEDASRDLAATTNAALMSAQFDFANQDLKIARLKTQELQKSAELARSQEQSKVVIATVVSVSAIALIGVLAYGLVTMRRSRNAVREVNIELETANEQLGKALKAKTEFLASTSHEIRTPLNGILGTTEVLLHDARTESYVRDRLMVVMEAGRAMRAMVDDLLDLAKAENGVVSVDRSAIDLHDVVRSAVENWRDQARSKGLELTLSLGSAPQHIFEDGERLRQVVLNLVSNAIKFTDSGFVRVEVCHEPQEGKIVLTVSDSGIGIAPVDQARVFESFTQVDVGLARKFSGAGLGLAISRRIVEALEGELSLVSDLGKGSTFKIVLPVRLVAVDLPPLLPAGTAPNRAGSLEDTRVLVLEPNPLTQSLYRAILGKSVKQLEFAPDYASVVSSAALSNFDVLFADWTCLESGLGVEKGLELIATLAPLIRLVVVTTALTPEFEARLVAAGASSVVGKPFQRGKVIAAAVPSPEDDVKRAAEDNGIHPSPCFESAAHA